MNSSRYILRATLLFIIITLSGTPQLSQAVDPDTASPPAPNLGEYYVDPSYTGSTKNGAQKTPWMTLSTSEWDVINSALASTDSTVYFPADGSYGTQLEVKRTDASSHILTLDGSSKMSGADQTWVPNTNSSQRFKLFGKYSLGLGSYKRVNNLTLRGFDVSGVDGRVAFGGSNVIIENISAHDTLNIGPTFGMFYATNPEGSCTETAGRYSNVIIRNNIITNSFGEALYVGGTNRCPSYGNSHDTILIENNTITNAGANGGQGDGIDIKDGLTNVTVRGNIITNSHETGITSSGVYTGIQNLLVENNTVQGSHTSGIQIGAGWAIPNGIIIRNNTVSGSAISGINLSGTDASAVVGSSAITVSGNTIYGNTAGGISIGNFNGVTLDKNNIYGNGGSPVSKWGIVNNFIDNGVVSSTAPVVPPTTVPPVVPPVPPLVPPVIDTVAPSINSISATGVTGTSFTVSWTTDEGATTQIEYGPSAFYGYTTSKTSFLTTSHSQTLSSLTPSTVYHYRVISIDAAGNISRSGDGIIKTLDPAVTPLLPIVNTPPKSVVTVKPKSVPVTKPTGKALPEPSAPPLPPTDDTPLVFTKKSFWEIMKDVVVDYFSGLKGRLKEGINIFR